MEDKTITQDELYTYQYVGTLEIDHLQFMVVDIEVARDLHNWWLSSTIMNKINELAANSNKVRVYFSQKHNDFIIEPFKE